jgi:Xaa-Pro dipeptidase
MVFFAHMIAMDSVSGNAMTLARTYIITDEGPQSVSGASLELIVK